MSLFERYLTWMLLCFVSAIIYTFYFMKQQEGKELSSGQKILYSLLVGIVVPIFIIIVFKVLGFGIFAPAQ